MKFLMLLLLSFSICLANAQTTVAPLITDTNYVYRSLTVAMQNANQVYKLNLSKHKLKEIPADVFKLPHLRELNLSHNSIKIIPPEISQMKELEKLNIANNDIDSLPDEIGTLTTLT